MNFVFTTKEKRARLGVLPARLGNRRLADWDLEPRSGLEPLTHWLTASRSTIELSGFWLAGADSDR